MRVMKKKINVFGLLFFASIVCLHAQSQYFYYYDGKKQHLELNTKHVFVSVAEKGYWLFVCIRQGRANSFST